MKEEINRRIVIALFKAWEGGTKQHVMDGYELYLSEDCIYENSGLPSMTKEETMKFFFSDPSSDEGIVKLKVDIHEMDAVGDLVWTERTDHHYDKDGNDVLTPKICGVFKLKGGKIVRWSDYFDPRPMLELFEAAGQAEAAE